MTIWFTSDTHFGHTNIIKYCNRPFQSAQEMDEKMIAKWNARVKPDDLVYHIGDFSLVRDRDQVENYIRRLTGHIHLVHGNHDRQQVLDARGFASRPTPYKEIKVGEQKIILCHYAFKVWNGSHRGSWNLHGHSHGNLDRDFKRKQLDVGVDCWNYQPISFEEIQQEMAKHKSESVDHHEDL